MRSIFGCPDCINLKHRYQTKKYYKTYEEFICRKKDKKIALGYFNGIDQNHNQLYCLEFRWDILKAIKYILRKVFYSKIYLNLHLKYEIWKIHYECNRVPTLSAYGVKERGTIKGEIPRKYKGSIEDMKKFEVNYVNYLKEHKTWDKEGLIKITLYEKYLKEDGIDIDKIPFDWNIQNKRIKRLRGDKNVL